MTGLITRPQHLGTAPIVEGMNPTEAAIGEETRGLMALHAHQLKSRPSPASLPVAGEKSIDERVFEALAAVKILTAQVAMHVDREWRHKLFCQLDSLHDPAEWDPGDEPVMSASFETFLKAILNIKPERRPGLGLSNMGHLVAAWTTGSDRLTIEFLPSNGVRWVLVRHRNGDVYRFAGQTPVTGLAEGLRPHQPDLWFRNEKPNEESS